MSSLAHYAGQFGRPSQEVRSDLESFCALVQKWNRSQNLVSRETAASLWGRHVLDSVQLAAHVHDAKHILDLGSGGGFPAIPLAIALKGRSVRFTLVESHARKASFLRTSIRELQLPSMVVLADRTEALDASSMPPVDLITSRAMAPLSRLLGLAAPFFQARTRAVFHKGREHGEEMRETDAVWSYGVVKHRSDTDPDAVLLEITNLRPR